MTLKTKVSLDNFASSPADNSVLQPGQYDDFEVPVPAFPNYQQNRIQYNNGHGDFYVDFTVVNTGAFPATSSDCSTSGADICSDPSSDPATDGRVITFLEPAGSVRNWDDTQRQQQADALKQLCAADADATYTFTPTRHEPVAGTQHQVGDSFTNDSNVWADWSVTRKDTVGTTDSVNTSATVNVTLFKVVDYSITAAYGHTWTTSHEFEETETAHVPPKTTVWLDDAPEMIRYTGNFTLTVGNTTIHLTGVYFDSPDPDGNGNWTLMSQSVNRGPIHATALH
jgi:hypothetical protein